MCPGRASAQVNIPVHSAGTRAREGTQRSHGSEQVAPGSRVFAALAQGRSLHSARDTQLQSGAHARGLSGLELGRDFGGKQFKLANDTRIDMGKLTPHVMRWIRLRVMNLSGAERPIPIDVFEDTKPPSNGFTVLVRRESVENVSHHNLVDLAGVFLRLAVIEENEEAKKMAEPSLRASKA